MAYDADLLTDDEEVLRDFRPHWKVLLTPILVTIAVAILAGLATWFATSRDWSITMWIWLVALVVVVIFTFRKVVEFWFTHYVLTTERIIVRRGAVARGGTEIPLESINNVLFNQRAIERMLRYGDVLVESAGSMGQSRLTDIPEPERFQSQIYRAREDRMIALDRKGNEGSHINSQSPRDVAAQLESLAALHAAGSLTDEEFAHQKRRLMEG
ncbi:MAG TPA: PH domain-containing protein [Nitriliruptoraceae bacterium]|nr:PH domain-containing protein [Nitriliruptoraceae bacterium]